MNSNVWDYLYETIVKYFAYWQTLICRSRNSGMSVSPATLECVSVPATQECLPVPKLWNAHQSRNSFLVYDWKESFNNFIKARMTLGWKHLTTWCKRTSRGRFLLRRRLKYSLFYGFQVIVPFNCHQNLPQRSCFQVTESIFQILREIARVAVKCP